jgi:acyl transferase domain-containing protein/SAM-dependent methyltransferase/acyl carrier protein
LLLEVTWEALERAAIPPDALMGQKGGVFIGISTSDYMQLELRGIQPESIDAYLASGGCQSVAAGRLSYVLGLQGPAMAIDTACSSSLVAVHLACQSLRSGESTIAIAGGVSLMLLPELTINFCRARMLAPDGRCKTFDKSADGYVRGEGAGVVVLKRLSDALAAGDRIHALVRGSAVNQDGRSSGLTVPNGPAQEAVIREALKSAALTPADVQYVEAHGTGTSLGDPIEVQALARALGEGHSQADPLIVGSAKTNIGHLEAAAGIAGLIKLSLALQHKRIPQHLHFREPNPFIDWNSIPVQVAAEASDWSVPEGKARIGGVSSFGFSGTNAHVILEEAPAPTAAPVPGRTIEVLALSARSEAALKRRAAAMAHELDAGNATLADVCRTAHVGRSHFEHRLAVVGADASRIAAALRSGDPAEAFTGKSTARPQIAFLFTGQGSQYVGMGRQLYDTEPTFRNALDRCDAILQAELGRSMLPIVFEDETGLLDQTAFTQPAVFALEYALFEMWTSYGIEPAAVAGHSLGEDVAACAAGVFSLEDGLRLIAARGRLMQSLPDNGAMFAVFASEDVVRAAIAGREHELAIAAVNGSENIALSGDRAALEQVLAALSQQGIKTRPMVASHAFHSPLMDPILGEFERIARTIEYAEPRIELISSVTGLPAEPGEVTDASYWTRHVRQPVRFSAAVRTLIDRGCRVFLEIGPSPTLVGLGRRCVDEGVGTWLASLRKGRGDCDQIASTLAALYVEGAPVNWHGWHGGQAAQPVELPTYPFERDRHWSTNVGNRATVAVVAIPDRLDAATGAWDLATRAACDQSERAPFDLSIAEYPARWSALEALTTAYMIHTLRRLGAFTTAGARATVSELLERHEILAEYRTLMERWLVKLAEEGLLTRDGDAYVALSPLPEIDREDALVTARRSFTGDTSLLDYVANCGRQLGEVLTGKESPLETLFPGGSSHLASSLYETGPVPRYMNGIVRGAVAAAAGRLHTSGCRVLEIGAGTGGTTAAVLPALTGSNVSYTFTDVGALFLTKAQARFAEYPFVDYAQFDIERDPEAQGFVPGSYDVIVAANVLHATRNLHATMDRTLRLLAPGGILVLLETTRHPSWFDVSTGLIHGWQIFDDELRGDHPLIAAGAWSALLSGHGAIGVDTYPAAGSPAEILGQHVVVARAPLTGVSAVLPVRSAPGMHAAVPAVAGQPAPQEGLREKLIGVTDLEARELLTEFVLGNVARVLRLEPGALGTDQRLMDLGVDSLMAVELRNLLMSGLQLERKLPATLIFDYPTVDAIVAFLASDVLRAQAAVEQPADVPTGDAGEDASTAIDDMDEAAVEALLNKTLGAL